MITALLLECLNLAPLRTFGENLWKYCWSQFFIIILTLYPPHFLLQNSEKWKESINDKDSLQKFWQNLLSIFLQLLTFTIVNISVSKYHLRWRYYRGIHCLNCLIEFTVLAVQTLYSVLILLKLLYPALTVACMPIYIVGEDYWNGLMGF